MDDPALRLLSGATAAEAAARAWLDWLAAPPAPAAGSAGRRPGLRPPRPEAARTPFPARPPHAGPPEASRLLVLAAHPDDEVIGAGARLPRLRGAFFLTLTDGAPRDGRDAQAHGFPSIRAYASARRRELAAALRLSGIPAGRTAGFGLVDQEAPYGLAAAGRRLAHLLAMLRAEALLAQAYEGGHPDHDAAAFVAQAACLLLAASGRLPPLRLEMAGYHGGPDGFTPGTFLPPPPGAAPPAEHTARLSEEERRLKRRLLACFPSQRAVLAPFPLDEERFRAAPLYDFTRPPHPGTLHYERHPWGMSGERFRALARAALEEMGLPCAPTGC